VSTATVSRVINGAGQVSAARRERVLQVVRQHNFIPNANARSLATGRSKIIGLVIYDITNPFFPELVQAADVAARVIGYSILLGSAAHDEHRALHYLDLMVDRRVDGMIIASSELSKASWASLAASPVPIVIVNADSRDQIVSLVTSDNEGGARLAAQHLLDLGHRRIAYIRGAETFTADVPRLTGFRAACRDAGLPESDTPELQGDGQFGGGERATADLLRAGPAVTAIACYNDVTAIGALRALRAAGVRVPADMSVIGCDDIAAASWVVPALTTVAQQKAEMGRIAVERLSAMVDHPELAARPEITRLPMLLQVRESTGPAPG